jgi:hypothetical protein
MSYFSKFSYVLYPNFLDNTGNIDLILKDITIRIVRKESLIDDKSIFYKYNIREGENIESISTKLYKVPDYYWTIMLINNRLDRFYDFPLEYGVFEDYIVDKYGSISGAQSNKKYFIRESFEKYSEDPVKDKEYFFEVPVENYTFLYTPDTPLNYPTSGPRPSRAEFENGRLMKYEKSAYDIEFEANEEKRNILVCNSSYIQSFVETFNALVR